MRSRAPCALLTAGAAAVLAAALAGCSPAPADLADTSAETTPATTPATTDVLPTEHVHGLVYDPDGSGGLLVATHHGLVDVDADGTATEVGPVIDLMGFAVTGPGRHLASGHPGLHVDLPNPVGLIATTDGGRTWTLLSRAGESDFHTLTALPGGGVLGYDGTLRRSADGRTWEDLAIPAEPHTLAAAPDGATVLATTATGALRSADAGGSWTPAPGAPVLQVVTWAEDGTTAVGVDPAGAVWTSTDAAATWQQTADLGSAPHAVAATVAGGRPLRSAVVTDEGLTQSRDGGQTFSQLLGY
ncbi:F510_1955 family glycosylhydrolase [Geodermatophilus sp. SYSU D00079]